MQLLTSEYTKYKDFVINSFSNKTNPRNPNLIKVRLLGLNIVTKIKKLF